MKTFKITYHNPPLRGFFSTEVIAEDETKAILKFMKLYPKNQFYSLEEI